MRPPPLEPLKPSQFESDFRSAEPALWCVAVSVLGTRDGAEDAVQDAALQAMGRLDSFRDGTDFTAWMAQIVRYTALNQIRRIRRGPRPFGDDLPDLVAPIDSGEVVSPDGQLRDDQAVFDDQVLSRLRDLTELQRTCLLLRAVVGLSFREIGTMLDTPESTAMSHVHRARQLLVGRLRDQPGARRNVR